jgi:hypothetical protein
MIGFLWRATVTVHRYFGVAVGALMLMWFASGIVMMYVPYPQLSPEQHLKLLAPILPGACCAPAGVKLAGGQPVISVQIESLLGWPMVRIRPDGQPPLYGGLQDGAPVVIDAANARAIALDAAPRITGANANIRSADVIDRDQWTVAEEYDSDRPLYRFSFDDPRGTQLYVSRNSGAIPLWTTSSERFWNWLGSVPHWLYFTQLRSNGPRWSRIVIWTSIAGGFLTTIGLYLGIMQFRRGSRLSPYRGWTWWHHLIGLTFGVLALTWVISGTISMNPWGFLEGGGGGERRLLAGDALPWGAYRDSLTVIGDRHELVGMVTLASVPEAGKLYWLAHWADGKTVRLDSDGRQAPVREADLGRAAQLLANGRRIESEQLLRDEDSYYYRSAGGRITLPVYRVILADAEQTRYYLDPRTGGILGRVDAARRGYRWLFDGLHRLDFFALLRTRPLWDFIMLLLLLGGTTLTATGCYLAVVRIKRDLGTATAYVTRRRTTAAPEMNASVAPLGREPPTR